MTPGQITDKVSQHIRTMYLSAFQAFLSSVSGSEFFFSTYASVSSHMCLDMPLMSVICSHFWPTLRKEGRNGAE